MWANSLFHLCAKLLIRAASVHPPKHKIIKVVIGPEMILSLNEPPFGMLSILGGGGAGSQNNSKASPVENWWAPAIKG